MQRSLSPGGTTAMLERPAPELMAVIHGVGERGVAIRAADLVAEKLEAAIGRGLDRGMDRGMDRGPAWRVAEPLSSGRLLVEHLSTAVSECRKVLKREAHHQPRPCPLAAVVTLVCIAWPKAYVLHVGNSRLYHFRATRLEQITKDHTMANRLVHAGALSRRRANASSLRNVVWNALSSQHDQVLIETSELTLRDGDFLILGTESLISATNDRVLARALADSNSAAEALRRLAASWHRGGGSDDGAVVVARADAAPDAPAG